MSRAEMVRNAVRAMVHYAEIVERNGTARVVLDALTTSDRWEIQYEVQECVRDDNAWISGPVDTDTVSALLDTVLVPMLVAITGEPALAPAPVPELAPLPETCTCGCTTFTYWETGYVRSEAVDRADDGTPVIYASGWDAMSEGGDSVWISCDGCGAEYAIPEELDWA